VPTKGKERVRKNNRVDARKLARGLRSGDLEAIYVPCRQAQQDRTLARMRASLAGKQTRVKNQIKATLAFYGAVLPEDICTGPAATCPGSKPGQAGRPTKRMTFLFLRLVFPCTMTATERLRCRVTFILIPNSH